MPAHASSCCVRGLVLVPAMTVFALALLLACGSLGAAGRRCPSGFVASCTPPHTECVLASRVGDGVCDAGLPSGPSFVPPGSAGTVASPSADLRCYTCDGGDCGDCACPSATACSGHGSCLPSSSAVCTCEPGWGGSDCSTAAVPCAPGSGSTLTAASGSFSLEPSSRFLASCAWVMNAPGSTVSVSLSLTGLALGPESSVTVWAGNPREDPASARVVRSFVAAASPTTFADAAIDIDALVVTVAVASSGLGTAFSAAYTTSTSLTGSADAAGRFCSTATARLSPGVVSEAGVLAVGSSTVQAPPGGSCSWLITPATGTFLSLELTAASLATGRDVLTAYDGVSPSAASRVLFVATGTQADLPSAIPTSSGPVFLTLTRSTGEASLASAPSFTLNYAQTATPPPSPAPPPSLAAPDGDHCVGSTTLVTTSGTVASPTGGAATSGYRPGASCVFLLQPAGCAGRVQMTLISASFGLVPGSARLDLYDGSASDTLLASFTGMGSDLDAGALVWSSSGATARVEFSASLAGTTSTGFSLTYTCAASPPANPAASAALSRPIATDYAPTLGLWISDEPPSPPSFLSTSAPAGPSWTLTHDGSSTLAISSVSLAQLAATAAADPRQSTTLAAALPAAGDFALGSMSDTAVHVATPCRVTDTLTLAAGYRDTFTSTPNVACSFALPAAATGSYTLSLTRRTDATTLSTGYALAHAGVAYAGLGPDRVFPLSALAVSNDASTSPNTESASFDPSPDRSALAPGTNAAELIVSLATSSLPTSLTWTLTTGATTTTAGTDFCVPAAGTEVVNGTVVLNCRVAITAGAEYTWALNVAPSSALTSYALWALADGPFVIDEAVGPFSSGSLSLDFVAAPRCTDVTRVTGPDGATGVITAHVPAGGGVCRFLLAPDGGTGYSDLQVTRWFPEAAADSITIYNGADAQSPVLARLDGHTRITRANATDATTPLVAAHAAAPELLVLVQSTPGVSSAPAASLSYTLHEGASACAALTETQCSCFAHVACAWCPASTTCVPAATPGACSGALDPAVCKVTLSGSPSMADLTNAITAAPRHASTERVEITLPARTLGSCPPMGIRIASDSAPVAPLVITGASRASTTLDCSGVTGGARAFWIDDGLDLTLSALTVSGGDVTANGRADDGGAVLVSSGTLRVSDVLLTGNTAANGGAVSASNGAYVDVASSELASNVAQAGGGALHVSGAHSAVKLVSVTLQANTAVTSGGGGVWLSASAGLVTPVTGLVARDNVAQGVGLGGALLLQDLASGAVRIETADFSSNTAAEGGAVALAGASSQLTLATSTLASNTATQDGGDVAVTGSAALTVEGGTLGSSSRSARNGGSIACGATLVVQTSATVSSASAGQHGGGIALGDGCVATLLGSSTVDGNTASGNGGGLAVLSTNATLALTATTVSGNSAVELGGGLYSLGPVGAVSLVSGVSFTTNTAGSGGAVAVAGPSAVATLTAADTVVQNNVASGVGSSGGGGILAAAGASVTVTGLTLQSNTAVAAGGAGGGALVSGSGSQLTVDGAGAATSNEATLGGGLAATDGGALVVAGTVAVSSNTATRHGGGVAVAGGSVTVTTTSAVTGNSAAELGGALYVSSESATSSVSGVSFTSNTAGKSGGAIAAAGSPVTGLLTVTGGAVTGNSAGASGGGILALEAHMTLVDVGVTTNTASQRGGGILAGALCTLTVSGGSTSVSSNTAGWSGGGLAADTGATVSLGSGVTVGSNTASERGGGIDVVAASGMTLTGVTVNANTAGAAGGGLAAADMSTPVSLAGSTALTNNVASVYGGGVFLNGVGLTMAGTASVSSNGVDVVASVPELLGEAHDPWRTAKGGLGGGVFCQQESAGSGTVTVTVSSTVGVASNSATFGGGVFSDGCALVVGTGGVVGSNTAALDGGGVYVTGGGSVTLTGATCGSNSAAMNGGCGFIDLDSHVTVTGSTLSSNTATGGGGGAILWRNFTLGITESGNTYTGNTAGFGNDLATFVRKLVMVSEPPAVPYASGITIPASWVVSATDFYDSPVTTQQAQVVISMVDGIIVGGVEELVNGVATFSNVAITALPGVSRTLTFDVPLIAQVESVTSSVVIRACEPGEFLVPGTAVCIKCEAGTYSSTSNAPKCDLCPMGSFCNTTGLSQHFLCPPGTFGDSLGRTSCSECEPGRYTPPPGGATSCLLCPPGTHQPSSNSPSCCLCPAGEVNFLSGQIECIPCKSGTFSYNPLLPCIECDESSSSCELDLVVARPNYWRFLVPKPDSAGDLFSNASATVAALLDSEVAVVCSATNETTSARSVIEMPPAMAVRQFEARESEAPSVLTGAEFDVYFGRCEGSVCLGDNKCAPHHEGELCGDCESGYELVSGKCVKCEAPNYLVLVGVGLGGPFAFVWFNYWLASQSSGAMKILSFFGQTLALLIPIFPRREATDSTSWSIWAASLDSIPNTCMAPFSAYQLFIIKLCVPVYFILLLAVVYGIERAIARCTDLYGEENEVLQDRHNAHDAERDAVSCAGTIVLMARARRNAREKVRPRSTLFGSLSSDIAKPDQSRERDAHDRLISDYELYSVSGASGTRASSTLDSSSYSSSRSSSSGSSSSSSGSSSSESSSSWSSSASARGKATKSRTRTKTRKGKGSTGSGATRAKAGRLGAGKRGKRGKQSHSSLHIDSLITTPSSTLSSSSATSAVSGVFIETEKLTPRRSVASVDTANTANTADTTCNTSVVSDDSTTAMTTSTASSATSGLLSRATLKDSGSSSVSSRMTVEDELRSRSSWSENQEVEEGRWVSDKEIETDTETDTGTDTDGRFGLSDTVVGSKDSGEMSKMAAEHVVSTHELKQKKGELVSCVQKYKEAMRVSEASSALMGKMGKVKVWLQSKLSGTTRGERLRRTVLLLVLFTYTPTMNMILAMLRCRAPYPEESKRRILVFDHTIECKGADGQWNGEYFKYRIVAIFFCAVYVYALPVALFVLLVAQRMRPHWIPGWASGTLSMLLFPFERAFFMYGPWLELRKTLVVSILQLSGEDPNLTRLLLLVLFTFFATLHLMLRPYEDSALDLMETTTLLVLLAASLLSATAWTTDDTSTTQVEINDMVTTLEYMPYFILGVCVLYIVWSQVHSAFGRDIWGRKLTAESKLELERKQQSERVHEILLEDPLLAEEGDDLVPNVILLLEEASDATTNELVQAERKDMDL